MYFNHVSKVLRKTVNFNLWPNVSLRDVTEGHFLIANLDT